MDLIKRWIAPSVVAVLFAVFAWFGLGIARLAVADHIALQQIIQLINNAPKEAAPAK